MATTSAVGGGGQVRLHGTDHVLQCAPGHSILAAALAAGLDVPYECASGSCGSCRARLLEGRVVAHWADAPGLGQRDRAKGDRILCCQSLPVGDCRVHLRIGSEPTDPSPQRLQARVQTLTPLNEDIVHLELETADGSPVAFRPGQFMLFEWPGGIGRRAYSMANVSEGDGRLSFLIKRKPGGAASAHLFGELEPGDSLVLEGPYGRAWLREPAFPGEPLVLLAGGSGLAPMWSIAQAALLRQPGRPVRLYFGVQRERDLFWLDEMQRLAAATAGLKLEIAIAQAEPSAAAGFRTGPVGEVLAADLPPQVEHGLYMAGPPGLVDHVNALLVRSGRVRADRVFYDRFV
jgi:toluene monooxygenase electron transfer component